MGTTGRPSRRSAGRLVTGGLALLCAGVVGASLLLESQGLEQARREAVARAVTYVDDVITPVVSGRSSSGPFSITESNDLLARIGERIRDDDVVRVRLWATDGDLLFSTDDQDGSRQPSPPEVKVAGKGDGSIESLLGSDGNKSGTRKLLEAFVPVPSGGDPTAAVAQVDQRYGPLEAEVMATWNTVRVAAGAGVAFFVALLLLSFARRTRTPRSSGGFGTPGSGRHARADGSDPRGLEKKLEKAEEARSALEEQLGQLRTQMAGSAARVAEQQKEFEAQLARSQERTKELEGLVRDAEARVVRSQRDAEFAVDESAAASEPPARIQELEQELARTRSELEGARSKLGELEPLVAESAARVEDVEARAHRGARAADARAQEAEAKADEHERQLQVAAARVAELEAFVKDSEQRMAASAQAGEEAALRVRELEGKLEGARHDAEALARKVEEAESRLAEVSTTDSDAARRAEEAERRAADLDTRILEMESHTSQLEELARAAEERAGTARFEAEEASRAKEMAEAKLEQVQAQLTERSGLDQPDRVADLEHQLAEAHKAGKLAIRASSETRAELEHALGEIAAAEARIAEAETRAAEAEARVGNPGLAPPSADTDPSVNELQERLAKAEASLHQVYAERDAARTELALARELGEVQATPDPFPSVPGSNGHSDEGESLDADAQPGDSDSEEEVDDEGRSLRFRLARSAANKKGKTKDRESMWS